MPVQMIYKNISIGNEASFGASNAGTDTRLSIISTSLNQNVNKELVEDTMTSSKGRDSIVGRRTTVEGDITGYATIRNLYKAFEWVNGVAGTSTALGATIATTTFNQNTDGSMLSRTVILDRNRSQEKISGVVATALELTASDDLMEWTLNCLGQSRTSGTSLADLIGETVKPIAFSDVTVTIHAGATYGANIVTQKVNDWSIKYDNGMEATHQSGSANVSRVDAKVPTVNGKFTIFHEGSSWVEAAYGCSEFYLRFESNLGSCKGLINGLSNYIVRIDVPRSELKTNVRNYEQGAFAVEEVEFEGMFDTGTSTLWKPVITHGINL